MRFGVILVCAGVLARALPVAASPAEDPEALIREGVKLRRQDQDARAEGYFKRAYSLAQTPRTAAQLGLVELALGEFLEAELRLDEALGARDAWVNEHRKALESGRATARQHLLRVELAAVPSGATYAVTGGSPISVPPDGVVWLPPGTSVLHLAAPGRRAADVHADGREGEVRRITVDLPRDEPVKAVKVAVPAAPPPREPTAAGDVTASHAKVPAAPKQSASQEGETAPGRGLRIGGIVIAAVGVAAGVAGAVLYLQGSSRLDEYRSAVNSNGQLPWNPRDESWKTFRQAGVACFIAGGAAVAGGAALYVAGAARDGAEGKVSFVGGPGFGVVTLRGAF